MQALGTCENCGHWEPGENEGLCHYSVVPVLSMSEYWCGKWTPDVVFKPGKLKPITQSVLEDNPWLLEPLPLVFGADFHYKQKWPYAYHLQRFLEDASEYGLWYAGRQCSPLWLSGRRRSDRRPFKPKDANEAQMQIRCIWMMTNAEKIFPEMVGAEHPVLENEDLAFEKEDADAVEL